MSLKIAIVGHGFVGQAVDYGFSKHSATKQIIDPKNGTSVADIEKDTDLVFIAVPTPFGDFSILRSVIADLKSNGIMDKAIVAIKSTVVPSILTELAHPNLVYNPEFLTEKNASEDFVNPPMHVFGGELNTCKTLHSYYDQYSLCATAPAFYMRPEEASMVKYTINSYLSTKVGFFNQIWEVCQDNNFDYQTVINTVAQDPRVGSSHTRVPGHDGRRGFGGACFPKDTKAFIDYSDRLSVLRAVVEANNEVRAGYELDDREKVQGVVYKIA